MAQIKENQAGTARELGLSGTRLRARERPSGGRGHFYGSFRMPVSCGYRTWRVGALEGNPRGKDE
jgi:hypothetical protein